ncbi:MAG: tRNA-dihydrouridine synthase, partial [Nanoarchaeota archaeon]
DPVDHTALQEIIDNATIPVVGNGFVTDGKSAKKLFDMGCSAVMVARAAVGNPWIFQDIKDYLDDKTTSKKRTAKDYESAWLEYSAYATKKKFYDYHEKVFRLRMKGDLSYHAPSRILNG